MEAHKPYKLFINADDFGYCPNRNSAIIDCFKAGAITDTSLLVNSSYVLDATKLGLKHNLPMGLHFNVSEGKPVSTPSEIPSLLCDGEHFRGKAGVVAAAENGSLKTDEVKRELRSQIEKFKSLTGRLPARVDGHQHVHVFPIIRQAFAEVLSEYGVKLTRLPIGLYLGPTEMLPEEFLQKVREFAKDSRELFSQHNLRSSDAFIGCSLVKMEENSTSQQVLNYFQVAMESLPANAETVEFMVHPGYPNEAEDGGCGVGPDNYSKDISRKIELNFLLSDELKVYFNSKPVAIQSWEKDL